MTRNSTVLRPSLLYASMKRLVWTSVAARVHMVSR
jgi:hypothetical protein